MFLAIMALIAGIKSDKDFSTLEGLSYMFGFGAILEIVIELAALTTYLGISI